MGVVIVCSVLALAGLAGVFYWGNEAYHPPVTPPDDGPPGGRPSVGLVARLYLWYLMVALVGGVGAGVLVAGAGGRLVMRLLAVTAGDDAQGAITEAEQIVGRVTAGGSFSFILFTAFTFGFASAVVYLVLRRWLPRGRLGGLAFGLLLLVVAATRLDPLRRDNADFGIVGPGWVALLTFAVVVVVHGMLVAALTARLSRSLPLISKNARSIVAYAPLLISLPLIAILFAMVGLAVVVVTRVPGVVTGWRAIARPPVAGRLVLAGIAIVALPGCVSTAVHVAGQS